MSQSPDVALKPIHSSDVQWEEWYPVPNFGTRWRHLTRAATGSTDYHFGVVIEELLPGRRSAPLHYHIFEEEHVYILEGSLTVRLGDDRHSMKPGDYICFPAGQKVGHCLVNEGSESCSYVLVGERSVNEVGVYPDSNKVLVRALDRTIVDLEPRRDYFYREDTGLPAGEQPPSEAVSAIPAAPQPPRLPISADDVDWREEGIAGSEVFGGRSRHLTDHAVGQHYHVGVLMESPAPGKRLAPRHYHMLEEEHALVLEGEVTLLLGDETYPMGPGDYVCFPAGQRVGHSFVNSGKGPCSYLMFGDHHPADVCVYPDSNKVYVRALEPAIPMFDMSAVRRYWDGEETGALKSP